MPIEDPHPQLVVLAFVPLHDPAGVLVDVLLVRVEALLAYVPVPQLHLPDAQVRVGLLRAPARVHEVQRRHGGPRPVPGPRRAPAAPPRPAPPRATLARARLGPPPRRPEGPGPEPGPRGARSDPRLGKGSARKGAPRGTLRPPPPPPRPAPPPPPLRGDPRDCRGGSPGFPRAFSGKKCISLGPLRGGSGARAGGWVLGPAVAPVTRPEISAPLASPPAGDPPGGKEEGGRGAPEGGRPKEGMPRCCELHQPHHLQADTRRPPPSAWGASVGLSDPGSAAVFLIRAARRRRRREDEPFVVAGGVGTHGLPPGAAEEQFSSPSFKVVGVWFPRQKFQKLKRASGCPPWRDGGEGGGGGAGAGAAGGAGGVASAAVPGELAPREPPQQPLRPRQPPREPPAARQPLGDASGQAIPAGVRRGGAAPCAGAGRHGAAGGGHRR